jgi:hypothetical protein
VSSNAFFSQYRRFALGTVSASDFAYWVLSHADEIEPMLDRDEWDLYLDVEIVAAEYTGGNIDEARLRERMMEIAPLRSLDTGNTRESGRKSRDTHRVG